MDKSLILFILQLLYLVYFAVADIKQECIASHHWDNSDNYGYGDTDPGEYREPDERRGGHMSRYPATGMLTCSNYDGGSIVVKRVTYGVSMYPGRCQADRFCGEESDTGDDIASNCDGQSTCNVDLRNPAYLKCGRMSTYMHVEYECINSWATFDVCKNASTVAREPSVYITSPNYLGSRAPPPSRGTKMCECILRSQDRADLYLEYLQTRLSSDQQNCPYEYVLLQNKENITTSTIDNELEVCGRREIAKRWFRGTLRIIMASGGSMEKRGLIAKITADNLGHAPRIDVECGTVPSTNVRLQKRPVLRETVGSTITRSRINPDPYGMPTGTGPYPPPGTHPGPHPGPYPGLPQRPYMDDRPSYDDHYYDADDAHERYERYYPPPMGNQPPWSQPQPQPQPQPPPPQGPLRERTNVPEGLPPPRYRGPPPGNPTPTAGGFLPDISRLRVKLPADKPTYVPPAQVQPRRPFDNGPKPSNPEVTKKQNVRKPVSKNNPKSRNSRPPHLNDRRAPNKKGTGRIVDDQDPAIEKSPLSKTSGGNGGLVALVFGGIGSALILGSVAILVLHNYRKRQRIKREEAEYAYSGSSGSSYGRGWPKEGEKEETVYATVKEVDMYRNACVNPSDSIDVFPQSLTVQDQYDDIDNAYEKVSENFRSNRFVYEGPAVSDVTSVSQDDIAVIEVHQPFDGDPEVDLKAHQHDTDCLRNFGYSTARKIEGDSSPYCTSCEIKRPPRRRDKSNGYDNNIGVRRQTP